MPNKTLTVTFLSVGQGDATLIEWPDGKRWLVDGGPGKSQVARWLARRGISHLDVVALTHPHPDHMRGLNSVFKEIAVEQFWVPRPPERDETEFVELWQDAWKSGSKPVTSTSKYSLVIRPEILHPTVSNEPFQAPKSSRLNDESLVIKIVHKNTSMLLTGDIEAAAESYLAENITSADILKVAHHGSSTSSTASFLQAVDPKMSVISCGIQNRFRHPTAKTLLALNGSKVLRTDISGTIEVTSNGDNIWWRSWNKTGGWTEKQTLERL